MAVLSDRDAVRWHVVVGRIAEVVEARLDGPVLANRVRGSGPAWDLVPVGPALACARRRAATIRSPVLLRSDVSAFYQSIDPAVVFGSVLRLGVPAEEARTAADMLEGWGSEGYPGLPIGPPGSAVLANAVLASVDDSLEPRPFLRWVDDYLVGVCSERDALEVTSILDEALGALGLARSEPKTGLIEAARRIRWLEPSLARTRR